MDGNSPTQCDLSFEVPPLLNSPPQVFGAYGDDSPAAYGNYFGDVDGGVDESNEAKRRRIARVRGNAVRGYIFVADWRLSGLRCVPAQED
jgi:hypothetical protein